MTAKNKKKRLQDKVKLFQRQCQIDNELDSRRGQIEASTYSVNGACPVVRLMAERAQIEEKLKTL